MKQFAIEHILLYADKEGNPKSHVSYFQHVGKIFASKTFTDLEHCKKYTSRADALIDMRKYFRGKKRTKIVQL